jgi:hypothetical protein
VIFHGRQHFGGLPSNGRAQGCNFACHREQQCLLGNAARFKHTHAWQPNVADQTATNRHGIVDGGAWAKSNVSWPKRSHVADRTHTPRSQTKHLMHRSTALIATMQERRLGPIPSCLFRQRNLYVERRTWDMVSDSDAVVIRKKTIRSFRHQCTSFGAAPGSLAKRVRNSPAGVGETAEPSSFARSSSMAAWARHSDPTRRASVSIATCN